MIISLIRTLKLASIGDLMPEKRAKRPKKKRSKRQREELDGFDC
jgi:hypothetical protein